MAKQHAWFCNGRGRNCCKFFRAAFLEQALFYGKSLCITRWRRFARGRARASTPCVPTSNAGAQCPSCAGGNQVFYSVVFDAGGGAPVPPPQSVSHDGRVIRPDEPQRGGYSFVGWFTTATGFSGQLWDFDVNIPTGDMTLYALWAAQLFTVAFDTEGGIPIPPPQTVPYTGKALRPVDPVMPRFVFAGWYTAPDLCGEVWVFDADIVTDNMTLYARWSQSA